LHLNCRNSSHVPFTNPFHRRCSAMIHNDSLSPRCVIILKCFHTHTIFVSYQYHYNCFSC
jgi:hypothetical protein